MRTISYSAQQQIHGQLNACGSSSRRHKHGCLFALSAIPSRQCRRRCVLTEAKAQRAVVLLPGLGNNSNDYKAVGEALESRGLHVQVSHAARLAPWSMDVDCPSTSHSGIARLI